MQNATALDFFAGSGLVTLGLKEFFKMLWANDICENKAAVYEANFGRSHLHRMSIEDVNGRDIPPADLNWASFPCQDLSLAGNMEGMVKGTRSGLFWQWLRVLDEMERKPSVLCLENVIGFLVAHDGAHFRNAYKALKERGYLAGAFVLDAVHFIPQSRPRSFLVAVREGVPLNDVSDPLGSEEYCSSGVMTAYQAVDDPDWIWWKFPFLPKRTVTLLDLVERDVPCDTLLKLSANCQCSRPLTSRN